MEEPCDDGEWVKASEAEQEIASLKKRVQELEGKLNPCEVCNEVDCVDSCRDYYIRCWKQSQKLVEHVRQEKDAEIARLRKALKSVASGCYKELLEEKEELEEAIND